MPASRGQGRYDTGIQGLGFRVLGLGFRVLGSGFIGFGLLKGCWVNSSMAVNKESSGRILGHLQASIAHMNWI